jgi:hypothetical protein
MTRSNPETPNKQTNSADTRASHGQAGDLARGDPESLEAFNGRIGGGDSQGGAYPNPHTGKGGEGSGREGFMGHGGQSGIAYHGGSQLGDQDVGGNENSATKGHPAGKE